MYNFGVKTVKIPGRFPTCLDGLPSPITVLWTPNALPLSLAFVRLPLAGSISRAYLTTAAMSLPSQSTSEPCALITLLFTELQASVVLRWGQMKKEEKNEEEGGEPTTITTFGCCEDRTPLNTVVLRNLWNFHYETIRWEPDYQFIWISPWGIYLH